MHYLKNDYYALYAILVWDSNVFVYCEVYIVNDNRT